MKKLLLSLLAFTIASQPQCVLADGGDAALGAFGGLAVGTMIGSAVASESHRSSRAEQEAARAQDKADRAQEKAEEVRQDQERQRIDQLERELDRRETERQLQETRLAHAGQGTNTMTMILLVLVGLLMLSVIGLAVVILRRRQ